MIRTLNTYKLYIIQLVILSLLYTVVFAQNVTVSAKLDTSEFLIGDQVGLTLEVKQPVAEFVGIPIFEKELTKQLEVIEQSENDTTLLESGYFIIKKRLLITTFDSGYYALAPIPFLYYSDTLKTDTLIFKVHTMPVDTSQAIKDIKMPYEAPLTFTEVLPWMGGGIGLVLIILIILYIIRKIKRNEPILGRIKPREPAHIIALRELTRLKSDKMWQKDKIKEYYTALTDILRIYLWNRYSIKTMERTSEEILNSLKNSDFYNELTFNELKDIFYISDLVKFAKYKPIVDDHEKCLSNSFDFIDKTKLIIEDVNENEPVQVVDNRSEEK